MMIKNNRKGFTLVEIMIVVSIIGLLAAIAIPNFAKARTVALKNACISNMKQIQDCVQMWAIDTNAATNATFATSDIVPNYMKSWPKCQGTAYAVPTNASANPVCPNVGNNTDHVLP